MGNNHEEDAIGKTKSTVLAHRLSSTAAGQAPSSKPNILAIFAADVGVSSIGACQRGMMGGRTPNINRIANEGALFTDYNAQLSCTAGRSALLAGQTRPDAAC